MANNGKIILSDRMATWVENKLDVPALIAGYFPDYVPPDSLVLCPFHGDKEASLHLSASGACYCHGCSWRCKNVIELVSKMEDMSYLEARQHLYNELVKALPLSLIQAGTRALAKRKRALKYLTDRGIRPEVITTYHLGYDVSADRITIPVFDQFGSPVNLRKFDWKGRSKYRVLNVKGRGEVRLFPEDLVVKDERILLVEGEWDTLIGRQCGIPTATWTGGAGSWNTEHEWMFRGKMVFVLYDNDRAGKEGAEDARKKLSKLAAYVEVLPPLSPKGKDLTDWYLEDRQRVLFLGDDIAHHIWKKPVGLCPYCGQAIKEKT